MNPRVKLALLGGLGWLLLSASVEARTWQVAKDGSGDFTVIQSAVDAAASGDTILIGPGRFEEHAPFTVPGWTEEVYVGFAGSSLTLIGSGQDITVIGPVTPIHDPMEEPKGIVSVLDADLFIQGLTIENVKQAVYHDEGRIEVYHCTLQNCDTGLAAWARRGMYMEDCIIVNNISGGVITFAPAQDIEIRNSRFCNLTGNVSFNGTANANVYNCKFLGGAAGIAIQDISNGGVYDCQFYDLTNAGIGVGISSSATINDNVISGSASDIVVDTYCNVQGTGNRLKGGTYTTIRCAGSHLEMHGNHILNAGGYSVLLQAYGNPPDVIIDLSDNYWGTADEDSIDSWIWDGNDTPYLHAFVQYEPFASGPIGTEQQSWGRVKALYK